MHPPHAPMRCSTRRYLRSPCSRARLLGKVTRMTSNNSPTAAAGTPRAGAKAKSKTRTAATAANISKANTAVTLRRLPPCGMNGAGDGKKEMLRKKFYVVRKKNHVVRKKFYVASIFGGAARRKKWVAGRKNLKPWELSSTAGKLSFMAGDFSPTASIL